MVRPRINQFADDMGITRSKAVNLINEGRRRRDGGSQTVETHMSEVKKEKKKKKKEHNENVAPRNPGTLEDPRDEMNPPVVAKEGKYMSCRGGGKAIQGTVFRGVS